MKMNDDGAHILTGGIAVLFLLMLLLALGSAVGASAQAAERDMTLTEILALWTAGGGLIGFVVVVKMLAKDDDDDDD